MGNDQELIARGIRGRMAIAVTVAAVLLAALLVSLGASGAARAENSAAFWAVCPAAGSGCDATSIQAAVDMAGDGDVINVVGNSVYTENVVITKTLTLLGGCANAACQVRTPGGFVTTIDGNSSGRVVTIDGDGDPITVTLDGFVITGGDSTLSESCYGGGVGSWDANLILSRNVITGNIGPTDRTAYGGGVYVYSGTVEMVNNQVLNNQANTSVHNGLGGGIAVRWASGRIESNLIQGNVGTDHEDSRSNSGGGIYIANCDDLTLTGNVIRDNAAAAYGQGYGGGLYAASSTITLTDNTVYANTGCVNENGYGGGINVQLGAVVLRENTIRENVASRGDYGSGGGARFLGGEVVLERNIVVSNTGTFSDTGYGGGLYFFDTTATLSGDTILSNTTSLVGSFSNGNGIYVSSDMVMTAANVLVARNHAAGNGSAIYVYAGAVNTSSVAIVNSTIADNTYSGIQCSGTPSVTLVNLILWGNGDDLICSVADLSYSDVEDGDTGPGVIHDDPLFVDPSTLDYHLSIDSPCIDVGAGVAEFPWVPGDDWDGDLRSGGDGYDMGADEFWMYVFLPLVLQSAE